MGLTISKVHVIPTSDHNMHMDNPEALANTIINDIYNEALPVDPNLSTILIFEQRMKQENELV